MRTGNLNNADGQDGPDALTLNLTCQPLSLVGANVEPDASTSFFVWESALAGSLIANQFEMWER